MAARLICSRTVLARSSASKAWVLGTLYVHEDDLRFDPWFGAALNDVADHLRWPEVSRIRWGRRHGLGSVEIVHKGGVELYCSFRVERLARCFEAARSACSPRPPMRLAA